MPLSWERILINSQMPHWLLYIGVCEATSFWIKPCHLVPDSSSLIAALSPPSREEFNSLVSVRSLSSRHGWLRSCCHQRSGCMCTDMHITPMHGCNAHAEYPNRSKYESTQHTNHTHRPQDKHGHRCPIPAHVTHRGDTPTCIHMDSNT